MFSQKKQSEIVDELRRQAQEKHEEGFNQKDKDLRLKNEITEKYEAMIYNLEKGLVPANKYLDKEGADFTPEQMAELSASKSKAYFELMEQKFLLTEARVRAEGVERTKGILEKIVGRKIRDNFDLEQVEKGLNEKEYKEYKVRLIQPEEVKKVVPGEEEEEVKEEAEKKKEKEEKEEEPKEEEEKEEGEEKPEKKEETQYYQAR